MDNDSNQRAPQSDSGSSTRTAPTSGITNLNDFFMQDKISVVLWMTRIFTIICTILFIVPITSYDLNALYSKALMASAATSALKLHQRMATTPFAANREYLAKLMIEDSFHYLLFALIFLNVYPVTIILMPVATFAILHVCNYSKTVLDILGGPGSFGLFRKAINYFIAKDKDMMRFIAINEIIIAPTILVLIFAGKSGIFVPFIYYRFICLRYQSRRNPYNRIMFYEVRVALEHLTSQPQCPRVVGNLAQRLIGLVIRLAPSQ